MVDALRVSQEAREKRLALSPRFRDGRFHNTYARSLVAQRPSLSVVADFLSGGVERMPAAPLPLYGDTRTVLSRAPQSGLRLTWLGHSTVLVEMEGGRLLTDPVWGERASPLPFAGPKRFHPPPLRLAELGRIDAVVLSHDHYDHLDAPTLRALARGEAPGFSGRVITTLGVGAHLERLGFAPGSVTELDWGGGAKVGEVDVVAVPAQHFSGRGLERNNTLWAGFCLLSPRHRVFFSGDTGPTPEHRDIGASFGPFDVAMFEIGAYHPAWGDIHLGPEQAYKAFLASNARALLPIHWSTFNLALHSWYEPGETLWRLAEQDGAALWSPRLGQPLEPEGEGPRGEAWWRGLVKVPA